MRTLTRINVYDPLIVNRINAHLSGSMDDLLIVEQDAHMGDAPFGIVEEGEITGEHFL